MNMTTKYEARAKRVRARDAKLDEIILRELTKGVIQAWPILETVKCFLVDIPERMVLRRIYTIMGIDIETVPLPTSLEDDYILL